MNITYQRNLHKSYMCIETTEDIVEPHELILLQKYKMPQLLEMQVVIQDGKTEYWFEITGKQQLTDYLGEKPISAQMLKRILFSLERVCEKMPEFLLKEERLSLQKELLYVDLAEETVYFTYLPFEKDSFPEKFRMWMADILKEINHQEPSCVELAYQVYEAAINENISIHQLLKEVMKDNVFPSEPPIFDVMAKENYDQLSQQELQRNLGRNLGRNSKPNSQREQKQELRLEETEIYQKRKIGEFLSDIISEKKEELQGEIKSCLQSKIPSPVRKYLQADKSQKTKESSNVLKVKTKENGKEKQKEKTKKTESIGKKNRNKKWQQFKVERNTYYTQKLYKITNKPEGKLIYQGGNQCGDMVIQGVEFFIGRNSKQADANIKTESVSRLHARILKKEGEYYIEDLNSTNGTRLNGKLLEYHKSEKLNKGDMLQFGAETYVFY